MLAGIFANLSVIAVYSRKRFQKEPNQNLWRLLAIVDLVCVTQLWKHFVLHLTDGHFEIETLSSLSCKIIAYTSHLYAISAWLMVYISVDRFFSIINQKVSKFIRKRTFQAVTCTLIFLVNLAYFSQALIYIDLVNKTDSYNQSKFECEPDRSAHNQTLIEVYYYIDMVITTILPFGFMTMCSFYLIHVIHRQRTLFAAERRRQQRDLKFSIRILAMNVLFIITNLPISVFYVANLTSDLVFYALDDLYYFGYVVKFFVYYSVHSVFRNEFLLMIHVRKPPSTNTIAREKNNG